jgi:hypothetical protein
MGGVNVMDIQKIIASKLANNIEHLICNTHNHKPTVVFGDDGLEIDSCCQEQRDLVTQYLDQHPEFEKL